MSERSLAELSDEELMSALKRGVAAERLSTVQVLLHLAELDRRDAVEMAGFPSLFVYCVRELGYSEGAAYRRIHAARCARTFPRVYVLLKRGRISLPGGEGVDPPIGNPTRGAAPRRPGDAGTGAEARS